MESCDEVLKYSVCFDQMFSLYGIPFEAHVRPIPFFLAEPR